MDTRKKFVRYRYRTDLWHYCLNHLLWKDIEEVASGGVFTRSFTPLLVAFILARDLEDDFLTQDRIDEGQTKLLAYVKEEMDGRALYLARDGRIV